MSIAKVTEIIASSSKSFDDAVDAGIKRANKKLKNVRAAWVKSQKIIASSSKSFDDAVDAGIKRANKKLKNVRAAWVKSQKAIVENGKITEYRVTLKVTFVLVD